LIRPRREDREIEGRFPDGRKLMSRILVRDRSFQRGDRHMTFGPETGDEPLCAESKRRIASVPRLLGVGPDICANPEAAQGFYGFHENIHTGTRVGFAFVQPNNPIGFTRGVGC
jgi:hypothetical protein